MGMFTRLAYLGLATTLIVACGDDDDTATPDASIAFVDAAVSTDARQCSSASFTPGAQITAGGSADLFGVGTGAWVGTGASAGPPGEILYIEAYADLLGGTSVEVTQFENWINDCTACVFYGTGCATYTIPLESGEPTAGPIQCEKLYMLERGAVSFASLDTTAASGRLMGTVVPLGGESSVRMAEVFKEGEASTATGYGQKNPAGDCLEVGMFSFDGTWGGGGADAGVSDAGVLDAPVGDATAGNDASVGSDASPSADAAGAKDGGGTDAGKDANGA